ncbi:Methylthioribose kinase [Bacillus cereus Rock4-18]|nr:Methylthioribose kinase [Bacillus cereus Rock4-18]
MFIIYTEKIITVKPGDNVQFPYRDNPSLKLAGYVVNILTNTIVVDILEMLKLKKKIDSYSSSCQT